MVWTKGDVKIDNTKTTGILLSVEERLTQTRKRFDDEMGYRRALRAGSYQAIGQGSWQLRLG